MPYTTHFPYRPLIIAHRGGPKYAPENTLAAFRRALEFGVDGLEFDVQMTKDGQLVVIHDETVDRTTNGRGAVRDMSLAEIRALDAGKGEVIPTFQEVLDLAVSAGVWILPELKSPHLYHGIEAKVLKALEAAQYLERSVVMSFDFKSLKILRGLSAPVQLGALYDAWTLSVQQTPGRAQYACPMAEMVLLNPFMLRQARRQGRRSLVWFGALENALVYRLLRAFGADAIIADDPVRLKKTLGR